MKYSTLRVQYLSQTRIRVKKVEMACIAVNLEQDIPRLDCEKTSSPEAEAGTSMCATCEQQVNENCGFFLLLVKSGDFPTPASPHKQTATVASMKKKLLVIYNKVIITAQMIHDTHENTMTGSVRC